MTTPPDAAALAWIEAVYGCANIEGDHKKQRICETILAALTTREAVVEDDATVERVAREVLFCVEMARTEVVNPVNGARPYSYVTFAGARIEFQQLDRDIKYRAGSPVYDAATDKAAAQAQRINDILFDVAKRAAIRALAAKEVK